MPQQHCTVLAYHVVGVPRSHDEAAYCCSAEVLRRQIGTLTDRGFRFVSTARVLDEPSGLSAVFRQPTVAITVDDGTACGAEFAAPIFREFNVPATFFVVAGRLGGTNTWNTVNPGTRSMMSVNQLNDLASAGFTIGSHTLTHPDLRVLQADSVEQEISGSKSLLEDLLQRPVEEFAYPYGAVTQDSRTAVISAGYTRAFSRISGRVHCADDPFLIHRIGTDAGENMRTLAARARYGLEQVKPKQLARQIVAHGRNRPNVALERSIRANRPEVRRLCAGMRTCRRRAWFLGQHAPDVRGLGSNGAS
jgi:peptidoglycan/xylan/chitin deacetylase (PgdA/CDA1 family)